MRKALGYGAIVLCMLLLGVGVYVDRYLRTISPRIKQRVITALSDRFDADVTLDSLHVSIFPEPNVSGEGLTIRHRQWPDQKPLFYIKRFYARASFTTLIDRSNRVSLVQLEGLTIHVPPRGHSADQQKVELNEQVESEQPGQDKTQLAFHIETIEADDASLEIAPKLAGKQPLDFNFNRLRLHSVGPGYPMAFDAKLTNAKPPGLIDTKGTFGPWQRDDPRSTAVTGAYTFEHADLGVFKGIGGTLSSKGQYSGVLQAIEVNGTTDTPNFTLKRGGDSVRLKTTFHSVVNGMDGDTLLDPVDATFRHSEFICRGGVVHQEGPGGKTVSLDAKTTHARMEDILALVVGGKPFVTGDVDFGSKIVIPPGQEEVIKKLFLQGQFQLSSAIFTSHKLEQQLETLSDRARGISKQDEQQGQGVHTNVASNLHGVFTLQKGTVTFSSLSFGVPGAQIQLAGSYNLPTGGVDMHGFFHMQATLADTQSGLKHWLLKPFDPLFEKGRYGFEVPITVSGTREHPEIRAEIFHRQFTIH